LLALLLLLSIILGTIPLVGIVWIALSGAITTVDGLFMSLILLSLSGVFYLNAVLEVRDRGVFPFAQKGNASPTKQQPPKADESSTKAR
jgi:hypothetical protein